MFFGLKAVADHPCYKMQLVVDSFFLNSIHESTFSKALFPDWFHDTLSHPACTLNDKFLKVHEQLHVNESSTSARQAIYDHLKLINSIEELCNGTKAKPAAEPFDKKSPLGKAIATLMTSLYESLDLSVFKGKDKDGAEPTQQFYKEFIKKNKRVCPFCGLANFKSPKGPRREDLDHYLNKANYPLAAANMKNLVPACGTCNQDYKRDKDILSDGSAFYPYAKIPPIKLVIDCGVYPATGNFSDEGRWVVQLVVDPPDAAVVPKLKTWDRVYSIKERIEATIQEFGDDWMQDASAAHSDFVDEHKFRELVQIARVRAAEASQRRMQPQQLVMAAFYEFILTRADTAFIESFRRLRNERYLRQANQSATLAAP